MHRPFGQTPHALIAAEAERKCIDVQRSIEVAVSVGKSTVVQRSIRVFWEDGDCGSGTSRVNADGTQSPVILVRPSGERSTAASLDRLAHEYRLKDELDSAWAVRPLDLIHHGDRTVLVREGPGGESLEQLLGAPLGVDRFLSLAIGITGAVRCAHQRGLVHRDLKPHVVVNEATGSAWLTGFGLATLVPRERQKPEPPEFLGGTLAYPSKPDA
jgi:serine/threonine protein kinase